MCGKLKIGEDSLLKFDMICSHSFLTEIVCNVNVQFKLKAIKITSLVFSV